MRLTEYFGRLQGKRAWYINDTTSERLKELGPAPSYVVAARDAAYASRECHPSPPGSWRRTKFGPLQTGYTEEGLPNRQRAAGRAVKLLMTMKRLYTANDRAAFDGLVVKFDRLYAILQDEPGSAPEFGPALRSKLFPRWCQNDAKNT